jgi:hypothetical protein
MLAGNGGRPRLADRLVIERKRFQLKSQAENSTFHPYPEFHFVGLKINLGGVHERKNSKMVHFHNNL